MRKHLLHFVDMSFKIKFLLCCFLGATFVQAEAYDEDMLSFDSIVSELQSSTRAKAPASDPFDLILMHAGVGLTTSFINIKPEQAKGLTGVLTGFELSFGIDLFSRHWLAEGSVRSFNSERLNSQVDIDLKEFDLKFVHHDELATRLRYRLGAGLSARYLSVNPRSDNSGVSLPQYSTPSSLFTAGLMARMSRPLSLGAELALRNTLIDETIDRSSLTASLRLDAHF